ncbi:MAG: hypothetical protein V4621_07525 [Pseudomonadota bacterium]
MRAALIENGFVVNVLEVPDLNFIPNLVDATNGGNIGDQYVNGQFIPPAPPQPPVYPPDTPEQSYLEYVGLIDRRADALMAKGDIIGALLLRESVK